MARASDDPARDPGTKLTYEDYVHFPDDGLRHEIIDGDHYVSPAPVPRHQRVVLRIAAQLLAQVEDAGRGDVLIGPTDLLLSTTDIVQPDVLVVLPGAAGSVGEKNVQGAPTLVVEVLSPSTGGRDRRLKRRLYERSGVQEYWIVDPDSLRIEQRVLHEGRFRLAGTWQGRVASRAIPGVEVDLTQP